MKIPLNKVNMAYLAVDYDYYKYSDCTCNDICRCAKITDCTIDKINYPIITNYLLEYYDAEDIDLDRFIELADYVAANVSRYSFEFDITDGYYGEELRGIYMYSNTVYDLMNYARNVVFRYYICG